MDRQTRLMVLGLAGSPRRKGNTDLLLEAFLSGAESVGAETKIVRVSSLHITACQACDDCARNGKCIIEDDFQMVDRQIISADVVALAAPLYFGGVPAHVKSLVDRSQCQWVRKYRLHETLPNSRAGYARRKGVLLATAGDFRANFEGMKRTVRYFFNVYEVDYSTDLIVGGVDVKGAVEIGMTLKAFSLGKELCHHGN